MHHQEACLSKSQSFQNLQWFKFDGNPKIAEIVMTGAKLVEIDVGADKLVTDGAIFANALIERT